MNYKEWRQYIQNATAKKEPGKFFLIDSIKFEREGMFAEINEPLLISIQFPNNYREYTEEQKITHIQSLIRIYLSEYSSWDMLGSYLREKDYEFTIIKPTIINI